MATMPVLLPMNQTFKTNIRCAACLSRVEGVLNSLAGNGHWKVDLQAPERFLEIPADVDPERLVKALEEVGYEAKKTK